MSGMLSSIKNMPPKNVSTALMLMEISSVTGAALFAGVVLIQFCTLESSSQPAESIDKSIAVLNLLALMGAGLFIGAVGIAMVLPKIIMKKFNNLSDAPLPNNPQENELRNEFLVQLFLTRVIRMAAMESTILFGIIVSLLAVIFNKLIVQHPEYWLCCLPAAFWAVFVFTHLPTKGRIEAQFQEMLARARGRAPGY